MNKNIKIRVYFIALAALFLICSLYFFIMNSIGNKPVEAIIYVDNEIYMRVDLNGESYKDFEIKTKYGVNKITVADSRICVSDADCPDRTCVKTGYTDSIGKPIICIPHRFQIVISDKDMDGIT